MNEKKVLETLRLTLQWLDNLEQQRGLELLVDMMPNNWRGRLDIRDLIDEIEQPRQDNMICRQCNEEIDPTEVILGSLCRKCGRENYRKTTEEWVETTLADHAATWWAEQGKTIPHRDSQEYEVMFETFINWAFANVNGCKLTGKDECNECGICRNRKKGE